MKLKNIKPAIFLAAVISGFAGNGIACGPFFPNNLLDAGDSAVLQPPVADFQRELERMKLVTAQSRAVPLANGQKYFEQSTEVEMTDLAAALKREKISSEQATVIMQAHLAERMKLNAFLKTQDEWSHFHSGIYDTNWIEQPNTNPPPVFPAVAVTPGLPREFADYFEGAIAWHKGGGDSAETAWERLLRRPAAERHFKSIWAAYMLGTAWDNDDSDTNTVNTADDDRALNYFEQVIELARQGFSDSVGLATASIGREARIYLRRKNYERAIELYLEQFAAGDTSAGNSLRFAAAHALAETNSFPDQLKNLARNPRTRGVITAYLISRNPYVDLREAQTDPEAKQYFDRTTAWLVAVESANVKDVESASQLALAAYQAGNMDAAQRWVNRAGDEPVAQWLRAKLFLRAGKITEAAKLLAKVSRQFPQELPGTNAPGDFAQSLFVDINPVWSEQIAVGRQSSGELGVLHLARREYTEALDTLLRSGYWTDAAYVAERVLTLDEFKNYVDRDWPSASAALAVSERVGWWDREDWAMTNPRPQIRYLLARRLARETGGLVALPYFPSIYSGDYKTLLSEVRAGHDETLPAENRAKNLFAAAVMTRTNGMELFGSELEPDWAIYSGSYEGDFTWQSRITNSPEIKINLASDDEIGRALRHGVEPEKRFHYRYQAAELAWEAAALMPDNSDETARVLWTAGTWLKNRDPQAADKFYKALARRCRKTALGNQADKMRWFPELDENGNLIPWSPPNKATEAPLQLPGAGATNSADLNFEVITFSGTNYTVRAGDSIAKIAELAGVTVKAILDANPDLNSMKIKVGQKLVIPQPMGTNSPSMRNAAGAGN